MTPEERAEKVEAKLYSDEWWIRSSVIECLAAAIREAVAEAIAEERTEHRLARVEER